MQRSAYVTGLGVSLPNAPVANDEIEQVLGRLSRQSAAVKRRALINNGIRSRHYAIDRVTGNLTHSNAAMTAEAVRAACASAGLSLSDIACLACGTSSADQLIPSHASMVHAALDCPPCEVIATGGVCCSGVSAFKYGFLNVAGGFCDTAVVTGSELASPSMRASHFEPQLRFDPRGTGEGTKLDFGNEFLRWMLSDGAGASVITDHKESRSPFATDRLGGSHVLCQSVGRLHVSGYAEDGGRRFGELPLRQRRDGTHRRRVHELGTGCPSAGGPPAHVDAGGSPADVAKTRPDARRRRLVAPALFVAVVPPTALRRTGGLDFEIPFERWFTNLTSKGNTGAASIYIMLEELVASGRAQPGERILCMVPESSRMMFGFIHLTVV